MAIDPRRIKRLLEQGKYEVTNLFHVAEDMVAPGTLRRNREREYENVQDYGMPDLSERRRLRSYKNSSL